MQGYFNYRLSEYALDGYEHDIIDYLLKPVAFDRFYRAVEKALQLISTSDVNKMIPPPISTSHQSDSSCLFVKTEYRIQRMSLNEILYIERLQNYISIQMPAERILSLQALKRIEEQLSFTDFVRVHRSFIVALKQISYIERSRIFIREKMIYVRGNYREAFYKLIDK